MRSDRLEDLKPKLKKLIQELSFETQDVDEDSHHHLNAQQKGISAGETQNAREIDRNGIPLRDGLNELVDEYKKTKDWIWYGLPTLYYEKGSATNKAFALKPEEFQAYLQTPALLQNLLVTLSCLSYAIQNNSDGAQDVLGQDYQKAQNSITALSEAVDVLSIQGNSKYDGFYIKLQKALADFQHALTDKSKASPESLIILHQESQKIFASRLGSPVDPGGLRSNAGSSLFQGEFSVEDQAKAIAASLAVSKEQKIRAEVQFDDQRLHSELDKLIGEEEVRNNFLILNFIQDPPPYGIKPFEINFLAEDGAGLNNFINIISLLDNLELNQKFRTIMPLHIQGGHWNSLVIDFAKKEGSKYIIEATQIDPKGTPQELSVLLKKELNSFKDEVEKQYGCELEEVPKKTAASPEFQKPGDDIKCGPYVVATIASLWHKEVRHIPVHELVASKRAQIESFASPMIKEQNTELARRLAGEKIVEQKHEYKPADTDPQSRLYNQTKLYNIDNDPKASVRIKDELVREQKAAAEEIGSGAAGSNNWQHQEILNKIADNLTKAVSKLNMTQVIDSAEFIRETIKFAQKYDGVGNAKDQTTGVRGEELWKQNFDRSELQELFPLAKQLSYEYQKAAQYSGVFTGRTENLKDTDRPIGARLKRIPEASLDLIMSKFEDKLRVPSI